MFKPQNRILIVDDREEHLNTLSKEFHDNGIGCKALLYDSFYSQPLKNVRVAFFDINLNPSGSGSETQRFASLAEAIEQYISADNGPFALIFWTQNKHDIEGFKNYISDRHPTFPKPFVTSFIDKDEILNGAVSLEDKLNAVLSDDTIELLFDFEEKASVAATETINQIYSIIPNNDGWGENANFRENFEQIFSKISTSSLGFEHAKVNPDKAIYEALMPILNYHIANNKGSKWSSYLKSLKDASSLNQLKIPSGFEVSILNNIFHIDASDLSFSFDTRGAVFEFNRDEPDFKEFFGVEFNTWLLTFLPIVDKKIDIIKSVRLIAIEISSACDFSQKKPRTNKYVLGVAINPVAKKDLKYLPDYSLLLGNFFDGHEHQIWVNLNYVFSASVSNKRFIKPLFIFKKEMMDMIGNRYATHVSRIGITSF